MDTVDSAIRSRIMSRVKGKNTAIEVRIRKALFSKGLRYRLHTKDLPGHPDIVFPKYQAVLFVNGCFWHSHGCALATMPKSRVGYWKRKFDENRTRDKRVNEQLLGSGWRVCIVWQCAIKNAHESFWNTFPDRIIHWLRSDTSLFEISSDMPKNALRSSRKKSSYSAR